MSKSPDAFRTISEVADWLGVQAHVLRFWESKFAQIKPVKRAGGRRYYRPADMLLLGGIKKLLHEDGLTIKGAQKVLREQGLTHVSEMSQALDDLTMAVIEADADEDIANRPAPAPRPKTRAERAAAAEAPAPEEAPPEEPAPKETAAAAPAFVEELAAPDGTEDAAAHAPELPFGDTRADPETPDTPGADVAEPEAQTAREPQHAVPESEAPSETRPSKKPADVPSEPADATDADAPMAEPQAEEHAENPQPAPNPAPIPTPQEVATTAEPDDPPNISDAALPDANAQVPETEPEAVSADSNTDAEQNVTPVFRRQRPAPAPDAPPAKAPSAKTKADTAPETTDTEDAPQNPEPAAADVDAPRDTTPVDASADDPPAADASDGEADDKPSDFLNLDFSAEEAAPAPRPRVIDVPPPPDLAQIPASPSAVSALAHMGTPDAEQIDALRPVLARLVRYRDALARSGADIAKD